MHDTDQYKIIRKFSERGFHGPGISCQASARVGRTSSCTRSSGTTKAIDNQTTQQSLKYLHAIVESRTKEEAEQYDAICQKLLNCIARPEGADEISDFHARPLVRDDDWWHCRRLLQLLGLRTSIKNITLHTPSEGRILP